jgi:hypothetical protein
MSRDWIHYLKWRLCLRNFFTEEQRSTVRFLWTKVFNTNDIHKEIFRVYCGECVSREAVHNWVDKIIKDGRKSQTMSDYFALLRMGLMKVAQISENTSMLRVSTH